MTSKTVTKMIIVFTATFVIFIGAILGFLLLTPSEGAKEEASALSSSVSPPKGANHNGYPVGSQNGKIVVSISTDFSCPYCQNLFVDNAESIRELAEREDISLNLKIVNIFPESVTNPYAISAFHDYLVTENPDAIQAYEVLSAASKATKELRGEEAIARFRGKVAESGLEGLAVPSDLDGRATLDLWIQQASARNRADPGVVPSIEVDGTTSGWSEASKKLSVNLQG